LICHSQLTTESQVQCTGNIDVFTREGVLIESMKGIELRAPYDSALPSPQRTPAPIRLEEMPGRVDELLQNIPYALSFVRRSRVAEGQFKLKSGGTETEEASRQVPVTEQATRSASLTAARQAAVSFAGRCGLEISPLQVSFSHRSDGKPSLQFLKPNLSRIFDGLDLSLADAADISVAFVGTAPVSVDLERVETRDAELWRGLLGADGYRLAMQIAATLSEPFDRSASRVWTVLECGKKAGSSPAALPRLEPWDGNQWITLLAPSTMGLIRFYSTLLADDDSSTSLLALTFAMKTAARI
jgi:hypothetical protein